MLLDDTKVERVDEGLRVRLAPNWEIWGPNGGYLAAIALRAAATIVPPGHRPASISVQFLATGKSAEARATAEIVRKGRSAWCVAIEIAQGDRNLMRAQIWTTDREDGPQTRQAKMPRVPPPDGLMSYTDHHREQSAPHPYWRNFDVRPVSLPWPTGEERAAALQIWFRYPDFAATEDPFADHGRSIIPIDTVMWPTHWRNRSAPADYHAPSLDLSVWFHDVPGKSEWLLVETASDVAGGGLIFGRARIWADDGRLLATGASNLLHMPVDKRTADQK